MQSCPTVFAFNVLGRVAQNFAVESLMRSATLAGLVEEGRLHLLPVVNHLPSSIEDRSGKLARGLEALLERLGASRFNLVACSLAGVDARHALHSAPALNARLRRLLTVAAPHNGSELLLALQDGDVTEELLEPVLTQLGVFRADFQQFTPSSMAAFNRATNDADDARCFSANGNTGFGVASPALQALIGPLLARRHPHVFSDGLFLTHETRLGQRHVAEFCSEHFNFGPFSTADNENVFSFYADFSALELGGEEGAS